MNRLLPIVLLLLPAAVAAQQDPARPAPQVQLRVPLDEGAERELRVYDIGAVVDAVLGVRDGVIVLEPAGRLSEARITARALRDAIAAFAEPPFDEGEEVQSLGGEHLAVIARPGQHAWIERFLALQQRDRGTIALLDVEVLQATPAAFAALKLGAQPVVLGDEDAKALRRRMTDPDASGEIAPGIDLLQAPRLAVLTLQQARVAAVEQVAYIKDFTVHTLDDGTQIADPEVAVIEAGLTLEGSFVVIEAGTIGLSWNVHLADLKRPIPKFETSLGVGQPVTIQLPNVATADFEARVVLKPGSLAVFPGPQVRGKRVIVLMKVAKLEAPGDRR